MEECKPSKQASSRKTVLDQEDRGLRFFGTLVTS